MKLSSFYIGLFISFIIIAPEVRGQDYQQMRKQIKERQQNTRAEINELNEQINQYEERLQLAVRKYEALYNRYEDLQRVIALQDQKLSKLQTEQQQIMEEIEVTRRSLEHKREELEQLVSSYKATLRYLYKHGRTSQLAMIFSSVSINQMLVRSYYLEQFSDYREKQFNDIRKAEQELENSKKQLEQAREKNNDILEEIKQEKVDLAEKKKQQERNVALLRQNREQIKKKLQEAQQQKQALDNTLSELIQEEEEVRQAQAEYLRKLERERQKKLAEAKDIEDKDQRAREMAKYSTPVETGSFMDEETLNKIEKNFAISKGDLPWPVNSRTISAHFGNRRHPVYGTVTPNLGVVISTEPEAEVRVVHDGYVINIQPIPGYGNVVVVKHGRYFTAYGNLSDIRVRKNQVLQKGDLVGLSGDEYSVKGESLFFLVRENNQNLDPENWLQIGPVTSR